MYRSVGFFSPPHILGGKNSPDNYLEGQLPAIATIKTTPNSFKLVMWLFQYRWRKGWTSGGGRAPMMQAGLHAW